MLGQLIDVLLGEVAPALDGTTEPDEAGAFVAGALMKVAGASPTSGRPVSDAVLPPELAARLALMPGLTGGGRKAVSEAPTLFESISRLFSDKGVRTLLREQAGRTGRLSPVNRMISLASDMPFAAAQQAEAMSRSVALRQEASAPADQPLAVLRKGAKTAPASNVAWARRAATAAVEAGRLRAPTAELPRRGDLPRGIGAQLGDSILYRGRSGTAVTTVADFIASLADSADLPMTRAAMAGLATSGRGLLLCLLHRLVEEGTLPIDPRLAPDLAMTAVRVYTNSNASGIAYRIARALYDSPANAGLPEGEQRRLANLLARAAMRSGRTDEAAALYRETFLTHPDGADAIVNYFTSIFATEPGAAVSIGKAILSNGIQVAQNDLIFVGDVLLSRGCVDEAETAFLRVLRDQPTYADAFLGLANVAVVRDRPAMWWAALQRFGALSGMRVDTTDASEVGHPFALSAAVEPRRDGPLVTVVTTVFNAADTLESAAASVLAQSAGNLELFIVDDVSQDGSRDLIADLAARDGRVKFLFNDRNMGTYASKNRAIAEAKGAFVTFHDSDDWMHPDRIATHLAAMEDGTAACTASQWIRMDLTGRTIVRRGGPYLHLNPASTFIRREVFDVVGPFDTVRTGADSEILSRIRNHFGRDSAPALTACLGVGLHTDTSLTQSGATAFDEYRYSPVRLEYTESWLAWHLERMLKGLPIALTPNGRRPFKAPEAIRS